IAPVCGPQSNRRMSCRFLREPNIGEPWKAYGRCATPRPNEDYAGIRPPACSADSPTEVHDYSTAPRPRTKPTSLPARQWSRSRTGADNWNPGRVPLKRTAEFRIDKDLPNHTTGIGNHVGMAVMALKLHERLLQHVAPKSRKFAKPAI